MPGRGKKPMWVEKLAKGRIDKLLKLAGQEKTARPDRAQRYCDLAWKISKRYNVTLPKQQKLLFCKKCFAYRISETASVRTNPKTKMIVYKCKKCGDVKKYGTAKSRK
ncbi:MAG: hypothetical protein V1911_00970 [Candidatus Micrarchaeota archaeon]